MVDSGSTNNTLKIINKFKIQLIKIDEKNFTYGRSLNIGCHFAKGQYCVSLSAHAFPKSKSWLTNFHKHFIDDKVAAVYGYKKHYDRVELRRYLQDPDSNGPDNGNAIFRKDLWLEYHFMEVEKIGTEDGEWGYYFLKKGYVIIFETPNPMLFMNIRRTYTKFLTVAIENHMVTHYFCLKKY